eukprot:7024578-Prymnesium_polylepis.1
MIPAASPQLVRMHAIINYVGASRNHAPLLRRAQAMAARHSRGSCIGACMLCPRRLSYVCREPGGAWDTAANPPTPK